MGVGGLVGGLVFYSSEVQGVSIYIPPPPPPPPPPHYHHHHKFIRVGFRIDNLRTHYACNKHLFNFNEIV